MAAARDIVKVAYDSFAAGDIPRAVSVLHPEVEWIELFPFAGTYRGRAAILELFERVREQHDVYEMTFDEWIEGDDVLVVLGDYRVRRRGASATFESRFAHVFWVEDGLIVKYEQLTDTGRVPWES